MSIFQVPGSVFSMACAVFSGLFHFLCSGRLHLLSSIYRKTRSHIDFKEMFYTIKTDNARHTWLLRVRIIDEGHCYSPSTGPVTHSNQLEPSFISRICHPYWFEQVIFRQHKHHAPACQNPRCGFHSGQCGSGE